MREAWNASWNVNTTGTQIITATFIPLLLKSQTPRLVFMASGTSTLTGTENFQAPINKTPAVGWPKTGLTFQNNIPAYRSAKCGMNMMMRGAWRPNIALIFNPNRTNLTIYRFYRVVPHDERRRSEGVVHLARLSGYRARRKRRGDQKARRRGPCHGWTVCQERLGRAEGWRCRSCHPQGRRAALVSSSAPPVKE